MRPSAIFGGSEEVTSTVVGTPLYRLLLNGEVSGPF